MATTATGVIRPRRLFFINCLSTRLSFLIDTGAQVSVIPPRPEDRSCNSSFQLLAANKTSIKTFGTRSLNLNLGLRRVFPWVFVVADVPYAILGIDFLEHYALTVDLARRRLTDPLTNVVTVGSISTSPSISPMMVYPDADEDFNAVLDEFPHLTRPSTHLPVIHAAVEHHIQTTGLPVGF